jgi:zinc transport system substrate-binding protein
MKKILFLLAVFTLLSCNRHQSESGTRIITVSIAPFKYFVEAIAGNDFSVNVMVPPGSNPHIYEPYPEQINNLRKSEAYISDGFLGFEMTWLDRFYEMNKDMIRLNIGSKIDPIASVHRHEGEDAERADPHYWVSPKSARIISVSVKDLLCELNPGQKLKYESNYSALILRIDEVDSTATALFSEFRGRTFMIYHPNLAYVARDYGLAEIPVEYEGKEPPPSRLRELIDLAGKENLRTIFVQREYDSKNAKAIAHETGAKVRIIDPLSEKWFDATMDIINALHDSFTESQK